jgi:hypothetical protein
VCGVGVGSVCVCVYLCVYYHEISENIKFGNVCVCVCVCVHSRMVDVLDL